MRKGFEVRDRMECEPRSGHEFVFSNRQQNRMELLYGNRSRLWMCAKRLEEGGFRWPEAGREAKIARSRAELALLLDGIDLAQTRKRAWCRRAVPQ